MTCFVVGSAGGALGRLGVALLGLAAAPAWAAEWHLNPGVAGEFGYDDNIDLDEERSQGGWSATTTLDATAGGSGPTLDLRLAGSASVTRYLDVDRSSSDAQLLSAGARRRGQRSTTELELSFVRDTTLLDPEESGADAGADERRLTFRVAPSHAFRLTPRDRLELDAGWEHRAYPDAPRDGPGTAGATEDADDRSFVDHDHWNGGLGWSRALTRRLAVGPGLSVGHLDSARDRTTTLGATLEVDYRFTDVVDLGVGVGPSAYRSDSQDRVDGRLERDSRSGVGLVVDGTAGVQLARRTRIGVSVGHGVGPGGDNGAANEITRVGINLDHRLTRALTLGLDGVYYRQRELGSGAGAVEGEDRDYLELGPGLSWSLQERLDAQLSYRYRRNEDRGGAERRAAASNGVFLRLAYRLPESRRSW